MVDGGFKMFFTNYSDAVVKLCCNSLDLQKKINFIQVKEQLYVVLIHHFNWSGF